MDSSRPLVTVVTPSYNCAAVVPETLRSVQAQSFQDWEHIVVDDCSSDDSLEVIDAFCRTEPRTRFSRLNENSGAAVARNTAIEAARGRYIAFVDSDDLWHPEKMQRQLDFMAEREAVFACASYAKIDEDGKPLGEVQAPAQRQYHDLLKDNTVGCLTAVYDAQALGKVYMPLIRKRQDLGLWLRLLKKTKLVHGVPEVLASYRLRQNSISSNKASAAAYTWRLYRDVEKLPLPKAAYYFANYAVNGVLKQF
ncbi:glycosyltransferase [Rhodobacteraceae bacterium N5(2021)]|uniref:Glycosyltransferase n=1 Tax=Gymnodinialimonas phycosphaerae TaxID=2841589 RepID=A0A975TR53_9RHOB|nr:glycosyltransferase family 2 protein [Gymnodinialimonas phycosphaerae]MBY4893455.1 glycosyltransferase [Gymnodinialimonas phycosphaerae]